MEEIWIDVRNFEDMYQVSSTGRVKNKITGIILKPNPLRKGYLQVALYKNGIAKRYLVHRLVWEAFNGPIPEGMQVNHINENKTDNRPENLNLMTNKENCNWGTKSTRQSVFFTNGPTSKSVVQYDLNGNFIKKFPSIAEAKRTLGISSGNIYSVCQFKRKQAGGFIWRYA